MATVICAVSALVYLRGQSPYPSFSWEQLLDSILTMQSRVLPGLRALQGWEAFLFVACLLICLFRVHISLWVSLTAQDDLRHAVLLLSALRGRIAGMYNHV